MNQLDLELQTKQKNRKKLIQQNIRLHTELLKLQKQIESLESHFNQKEEDNPQLIDLKAQIDMQQKQIKQIKEIVEVGRQSKAKQNIYYIKKQEDELLWMKQQLQILLKEKEVVTQSHQDKVRKLASNEPLLKHKEELQRSWNDTKKQNKQMSLKIVQMQREVRKLHALKERSKDKDTFSNEEVEMTTIQSQIARMISEMKMKESKWKPNGQILDNQFFSSKNTLQTLIKKMDDLQKQEGTWRLRAAALRDHSQIMTDRERLSKIVSLPKPEPIIKPVIIAKEQVKPQQFEKILTKQVRDKVKADKFADLIRVSSTPVTNLKKTNNLKQSQPAQMIRKNSLNQQISNKQSPKSTKLKEKQVLSSFKDIQIYQKKPKNEKNEKEKKQKSPLKDQKVEQASQPNKNGNIWLGRREKLKSKQFNGVGLAQIIRQKAQEVKKMNQKLQEYEEKDRSISSPKKKRGKQQINTIRTPQNKVIKNKSRQKIQISQYFIGQQQLSQKKKKKNEVKQVNVPDSNHNKINQIEKKMTFKSSQTPKRNKQQNLSQNVDIRAKTNEKSTSNLSKSKKQNKNTTQEKIKINPVIKMPEQTIENKQKRKETKPKSPLSPKSLKQKQKNPVFEILISDNSNAHSPQNIQISSSVITAQLDDEMDGIPKIIIRKKVNNSLVTTGTST